MTSIRLDPKHGVNPSLEVCFYCQKDIGVVLMGKIHGKPEGTEAPRKVVTSYEPCDECKANMAKGITLIECRERPLQRELAIREGLYPTGSWAVITEDAVRRIFQPESVVADVLKHRKAFVMEGLLKHLGITGDQG